VLIYFPQRILLFSSSSLPILPSLSLPFPFPFPFPIPFHLIYLRYPYLTTELGYALTFALDSSHPKRDRKLNVRDAVYVIDKRYSLALPLYLSLFSLTYYKERLFQFFFFSNTSFAGLLLRGVNALRVRITHEPTFIIYQM
jgi:hypothetical protein